MFSLAHIGVAVKSISESWNTYACLSADNGEMEKTFIASQEVYVCFVRVGDVTYELIEPASDASPISAMLKKGVSYYHLAYFVDDFDAAKDVLLSRSWIQLNEFPSEAFNEKRCAFFSSPQTHLIEIIEKL